MNRRLCGVKFCRKFYQSRRISFGEFSNLHRDVRQPAVKSHFCVSAGQILGRLSNADSHFFTRFCEFDGWRPPKHEPILVIGMWLNNRYDPLNVDLKTRLDLYRNFFPENKFKFDCSCGIEYSEDYINDNLWK